MLDSDDKRPIILGEYLAANNVTVRQTAAHFGISKSTVHKDLTEKLPSVCPSMYPAVREILEINKDHQLVKKAYELLKNTEEKEKQEGSNMVQMIMDLACISQGEHLENPAQSVKRILSLMK